ncbi:hypothetical protein BJX66DRAFT_316485 [Aspergillus keveii]|uniref:Uncharacterized protein n=1 Tax=Aspergillus keveii TaxID=714993 RepID=A0ABR4FMM8_9EURO
MPSPHKVAGRPVTTCHGIGVEAWPRERLWGLETRNPTRVTGREALLAVPSGRDAWPIVIIISIGTASITKRP